MKTISSFYFLLEPPNFSKWIIDNDRYFSHALALAFQRVGTTHPNPSVGAVLVKNGQEISLGHTHPVGGAHAEADAIYKCPSDLLRDSTLYVTLEPCSHIGRTPPCTDAIIKSGIKEVIYGAKDPNPLVDGVSALSLAKIKSSPINNDELIEKSIALIRPFEKYIRYKRPLVVAKIATSLDGMLSSLAKRTKITTKAADELVHMLRKSSDAIMVGESTVMIDNPLLTVRFGQNARNPLRVVLSHDLSLDPSFKIFNVSDAQTVIITSHTASFDKCRIFEKNGIKVIKVNSYNGLIDLKQALESLGQLGITSLMVEPGKKLLSSLIREDLVDELWWFVAPIIIGNDGLCSGLDESSIDNFKVAHEQNFGIDRLRVFIKAF